MNVRSPDSPDPARLPNVVRWATRAVLAAAALFWTSFILANLASQGWDGWRHVLPRLTAVLGLPVLALLAPRVGGPVLVLAGAWTWSYYRSPAAQGLLAALAIACGVAMTLLAWLPPRKRPESSQPDPRQEPK
jgi:hypothetical protein